VLFLGNEGRMKKLMKSAASLLLALLLAAGLFLFALLLLDDTDDSEAVVVAEDITEGATMPSLGGDIVLSEIEALGSEQQQTLPGAAVPYAASLEESVALTAQQNIGSWSMINSALSLIGLIEALALIGSFFYQKKEEPLIPHTRNFRLRVLLVFLTLVFFVSTLVVSDFAGSVVVFDKVSLLVVALFSIQQAIMLSMRKTKTVAQTESDEESGKQFRAMRRYESGKTDS
jgi:hypothetical protein